MEVKIQKKKILNTQDELLSLKKRAIPFFKKKCTKQR